MELREIKTYKFEELEKRIQDKVLSYYQYENNNSLDFYLENIEEDIINLGEVLSIDIDRKQIYVTGFYQQGSGSSFTGYLNNIFEMMESIEERKWEEILYFEELDFPAFPEIPHKKMVMNLIKNGWIDLNVKSEPSRNCNVLNVHWEYICYSDSGYYGNNYHRIHEVMDKICDWVENVFNVLNDFLYSRALAEYEYLTSEELARDYIAGLGLVFTEDGKEVNKYLIEQ